MDLATARRCVAACAKYLRRVDDSPRAARDLEEAVRVIEAGTPSGWCEHCGDVYGKVYSSSGTSWCKACWDTLTEEEKE